MIYQHDPSPRCGNQVRARHAASWPACAGATALEKSNDRSDPLRSTVPKSQRRLTRRFGRLCQPAGHRDPHCWLPKPGYRADGNCRAAWSRSRGERVPRLRVAPIPGIKVQTASERAGFPARWCSSSWSGPAVAGGRARSRFAVLAMADAASAQPLPRHAAPVPDRSHPAMAVQLMHAFSESCVRPCREVQVNDVIGGGTRLPRERSCARLRRPDGQ